MSLTEGEIVSGKVTTITKFGAFVTLEGGKSGLVHISEIADTYVSDVHQYLTEGQEVKVKILPSDKAGRINLSIKKAAPPKPAASPRPQQSSAPLPRSPRPQSSASSYVPSNPANSATPQYSSATQISSGDNFEEKLRAFMKDSESKMSSMKNPPEKKGMPRRMRTKNN